MSTLCDENLLLTCRACGKKFFSQGESQFYLSKSLTIPYLCKECREERKKKYKNENNFNHLANEPIDAVYDEIINNWSVEAKKENSDYFYNVKEVSDISEGKKIFVIGRKGSGKTAIAQHICAIKNTTTFTDKLSFKNFPFNILYSLQNNKEYTSPNQYISIWKYLIYSYICKKMISNENIDTDIRTKLESLYGECEVTVKLNKLIEKWTSKSFGAEILGVGFSYEREKQVKELTWIDTIEILENVILQYCDTSKYFIVFDELDEDYKDFTTKEEETQYKSMLISLFKAIQDIKSIFASTEKQILPVVFLRSDIYDQLKDSDKNKWSESIIYLEWDRDQIQNMLSHRLSVAFGIPDENFNTVWHKIFSKDKVKMGHRQDREMDIYTYIERSTEMRPRDFIQYVKECAIIARKQSEHIITPNIVTDVDDRFSDYLKRETVDEIYAVLPEVNEILDLLSTIRKQTFKFSVFEQEYQKLVERSTIKQRDVRNILLILFDAGVIGNKPAMKTKALFRFSKNSPRFNYKETMMIHRGLYKALQIF